MTPQTDIFTAAPFGNEGMQRLAKDNLQVVYPTHIVTPRPSIPNLIFSFKDWSHIRKPHSLCRLVVNKSFYNFVEELACTNHSWKIIAFGSSERMLEWNTNLRSWGSDHEIYSFEVQIGGKRVGTITYTRGKFVLGNNFNISQLGRRNDVITTSNRIRAAQLARQYFTAPTVLQHKTDALVTIESAINRLGRYVQSKVDDCKWRAMPFIEQLLYENPDFFKSCFWYPAMKEEIREGSAALLNMRRLRNMFESLRESKDTPQQSDSIDMSGPLVVVQVQQTYIVLDKVKFAEYTHETLPYDIRAKLGVLKLTREDELVDNVGIRTSANFFFIVPDHEQQPT